MGHLFRSDQLQRFRALVPWLGLLLLAALSVPPLLVERPEVTPVPSPSPVVAWASRAFVLAAMLGAIGVATWAARGEDAGAPEVVLPLVLMAALMTAWHWYWRDSDDSLADWQRQMYFDILNHRRDAPHQFRALPYGFARTLEHVTGDWTFACAAYRWFFTYWFVWGCYRFARLWLPAALALIATLPVGALYPLSVLYYWGQLTDPLSHALFVSAFIYAARDRSALLAAALALGVLAKETVVLMVPVYWFCYWRGGLRPLLKAAALAAVCGAAFLAARLPLGWRPGYENINGTEGLMVLDNLGLGGGLYRPTAPLWQNFLQPALFVVPFLPLIVWGWRGLDRRLKVMCLTLTPLLLLSNLCFGWLYESRNYMPLVPLLATAALCALSPASDVEPRVAGPHGSATRR
jgi:hypothetical protein